MTIEAITFDLGGMPPIEVQLASASGLAPLPLPDAIRRFQTAMAETPEMVEKPEKPIVPERAPVETPRIVPEAPQVVAREAPQVIAPEAPIIEPEAPIIIPENPDNPEMPVKAPIQPEAPIKPEIPAQPGNPLVPEKAPIEAPRIVQEAPQVVAPEAPKVIVPEAPIIKPEASAIIPEIPGTPDIPDNPETPVKAPIKPEALAQPEKPLVPGKPIVPEKPIAPEKAAKPEAPAAIDAPVQPAAMPQTAPIVQPETVRVEAASARTIAIVETVNEVVEAVAAQISVTPTLAQGEGEIRIVLKPTVLDGSEIRLSAKEGALTVAITPSTPESARVVAVALPQLETALAEHAPAFNHVAVVVATAKKGKINETA